MSAAARYEIAETEQDRRRDIADVNFARAADRIRLAAVISGSSKGEGLSCGNRGGCIDVVPVVRQQAGADVKSAEEILVVGNLERPQVQVAAVVDPAFAGTAAVIEEVKPHPHVGPIGYRNRTFGPDSQRGELGAGGDAG